MSKATLENALRDEILKVCADALAKHFDTDILTTGAGAISLPVVDAEHNDVFGCVKVTIPRGTRVGGTYQPYDGYAAAEDYKMIMDDRAAKKKVTEAKALAAARKKEQAKENRRLKTERQKAILAGAE